MKKTITPLILLSTLILGTLCLNSAVIVDPIKQDFINNESEIYDIIPYVEEGKNLKNISRYKIDWDVLTLCCDSNVTVFYISEGAGYTTNDLGVNFRNSVPTSSTPTVSIPNTIIFEDINEPPMSFGDYVNLGVVSSGTVLDFFLNVDKINTVFVAGPQRNSDKIEHLLYYGSVNEYYHIFGFEDLLKGGDLDYNDLIFAVKIDCIPEPSTAILLGMGMIGLINYRKRI